MLHVLRIPLIAHDVEVPVPRRLGDGARDPRERGAHRGPELGREVGQARIVPFGTEEGVACSEGVDVCDREGRRGCTERAS